MTQTHKTSSSTPAFSQTYERFLWILFTLILIALISLTAYIWIYTRKTGQKSYQAKQPILTPFPPAPSVVLKAYVSKEFSFRYPLGWEILTADTALQNNKMLKGNCTLILKNTQEESSIIAVVYNKSACWSTNSIEKAYFRKIRSLQNRPEIEVSKLLTYDTKLARSLWLGELLEQYTIHPKKEAASSKSFATIALLFTFGKDRAAEIAFDHVVSSFKLFQ